jgi:hypothetical protein
MRAGEAHRWAWVALFVAAAIAGCGKELPPRAESPEVTLRAEPLHFFPGEVVTATLKVVHPGDVKPEPGVTNELLGNLTVIEGPVVQETALAGGWKQTVFTWRLTGYLPGPVTIGPVAVKLGEKRGPSGSSIALTIDDPLKGKTADLKELRGQKGILGIPYAALTRLLAWIGVTALLVVGGIISLIVWYVRRGRPPIPAGPLPTPKEKALAALEALRETLPTVTDFKPLYYEMNLVLRRFIEEEFGFAASRETTEEFLEAALTSLPKKLQEGLDDYFRACDLVKYAGYPVDRKAAAAALDTAVAFVNNAADRPKPLLVEGAAHGTA